MPDDRFRVGLWGLKLWVHLRFDLRVELEHTANLVQALVDEDLHLAEEKLPHPGTI